MGKNAHPTTRCSRVSRLFRSLTRNESGAVAIIAALLLPLLVGGMGLGAETGYWHLKQRKLQHAADLGVHAAAVRYRAGDSPQSIRAAALRIADASGFEPARGTMSAYPLPGLSPKGGRIAVDLVERYPRLFSAIFSKQPMVLKARAVAELDTGSRACVLALSPEASGAVTVTGSTEVSLADCSVASNSGASDAFLMKNGSALMTAECVYTVGMAVTTPRLTLTSCVAPVMNSPATPDPFSHVAEPERGHIDQLPCRDARDLASTNYRFDRLVGGGEAIRLCGGLSIKKSLDLKPGLYVLDGGGMRVNANARLSGQGVTFLLTQSAEMRINGNGAVDLSAPSQGPYAGLLVFGSRHDSGGQHKILGNSNLRLQGTLYAPSATIDFTGNSTLAGGCVQIVADQVTFTGNSNLESCADETGEILIGQSIAIVE